MKYLKPMTIGVLPLMWTAYFLFELFTGRVTDYPTIWGNVVLIILFALVGYCAFKLSESKPNGFTGKYVCIFFALLMLVDQGIKIIIKFFFFNDYFEIIKGFLSFNPIINTDGSWLNARFGTSVSFPLLISVNILALILFVELYRYYLHNYKDKKSFWADMCFLFITAGALCSLIDKVFYGGSLDFIGISNLFIADIKDIYINLGILFFILAIYQSGYLTDSEDTTFKDDLDSFKKFLLFIKNDICRKLK